MRKLNLQGKQYFFIIFSRTLIISVNYDSHVYNTSVKRKPRINWQPLLSNYAANSVHFYREWYS